MTPQKKRRVPKGKPFVKGDPRINAGGISKEAKSFAKRFHEALAAGGDPKELAALIWEKALRGQPWAVEILLDRAVGKPKENEGDPLEMKLTVEVVKTKGA